MDIPNIPERSVLVNFRAPKDTIDLLDQVSRFDRRTRTSVILDLINNWIGEKTREIPQRIQAKNDLKSALNSHEQSTHQIRRADLIKEHKITNRNEAERVLSPLFYRSTGDFDDPDNGRF